MQILSDKDALKTLGKSKSRHFVELIMYERSSSSRQNSKKKTRKYANETPIIFRQPAAIIPFKLY